MDMPQVHTCAQLIFENEKLRKCLRRLKRENSALSEKLHKIEEKQKIESFLRDYVTTRDSSSQTDPLSRSHLSTRSKAKFIDLTASKNENKQESEKLNKMMTMHSGLMRKYEKELKINAHHTDVISELHCKVNELEMKLTDGARETADLRSQRLKRRECSPEILKQLRKERDALKRDKTRLKTELKGLDHGFFEEIEDIKFALQQSTKLNEEYDQCLTKLCSRFGVPHPHPQRNINAM